VNLEVLGQNGEYVFWQQDGTSLKLLPVSEALTNAVCSAVTAVTGETVRPAGPVNSDGGSFLFAGIPAAILGTYDRVLKDRGFHSPADNLGRILLPRLQEAEEILSCFMNTVDSDLLALKIHQP
jgi:hypothetical protein